MLARSAINRRIIFWFTFFVVFLISGYALKYYFEASGRAEEVKRKYSEALIEKEQLCLNALRSIKDSVSGGGLNTEEMIYHPPIPAEDEISFFVYDPDSLIYWSDIGAPVSAAFSENDFKEGLYHTDNGWYEVIVDSTVSYRMVCLILLKHDFLYQNRHLVNKFANGFDISERISISENRGGVEISNYKGDFLHSLTIPEDIGLTEGQTNLVFIALYLSYLCLLYLLYLAHYFFYRHYRRRILLVSAYIADVFILLLIIRFFSIPEFIFGFRIFSPALVSSSPSFSSLGDYLLNCAAILAASMAFYKHFRTGRFSRSFLQASIATPLVALSVLSLYHFSFNLISSLILNSSISLDLNNITNISNYSLLGFLVIAMMVASFGLVASRLVINLFKSSGEKIGLLLFIFLILFYSIYFRIFSLPYLGLVFLFLMGLPFLPSVMIRVSQKKFATLLYFLFAFSIFITLLLFSYNSVKEKNIRKMIAIKMSLERDPVAEFKFQEIHNELLNDSILAKKAIAITENPDIDPEITRYIKKEYLHDYWERFDLLVTACDNSRLLDVQPGDFVVNCHEYFSNLIEQEGKPTLCDGLYFLDYEIGIDNYLAVVETGSAEYPVKLYIELYSKDIPRDPGYPELLIDERTKETGTMTDYSMAKYRNNDLIFNYGRFFYSTNLSYYPDETDEEGFFETNGYLHLKYSVNEYTLIISKKLPSLPEKIAPFSYLFLFFALVAFVLMFLFHVPFRINTFMLNIRKRLQLSMISLIFASFVVIGFTSVFYIVRLNNNKNQDIISEKAHSVLVELEHKLAGEEALTPEIQAYLSDLLYKFSLVFFSDINLFDLNGNLLASSRPEIFNKGLISRKMDPVAYERMLIVNKSLFIHDECIGNYKYLSAYLPFRNTDNNLIAILNLPYFARQDELTMEISTFLVALVNIYVILVVITIVVALIISSYVAKPLRLIREKIGRLNLGKTNEKIEWPKRDEISGLVSEYNRMVDELARSAEMLARSERESAWREMARQVAHEIKNPLTPMKLSVQHLKKAWDEKAPDWEIRLERFTKNLIMQIDSLSVIASEFSNFAKMPKSRNERIEITSILQNAVDLFTETSPVRMVLYADPDQQYFVLADKEQLLRVFNNLLKNSIQAIDDVSSGLVEITLKGEKEQVVILFGDNGIGIPESQKEKVFSPNFTTKSSGMGLGLAMAKSIIDNAGGSIGFESEEGRGTTFIIRLPLLK